MSRLPTQPPVCVLGFSTRVKRPGHEVNLLPLSSAEVKNECSSTGTPVWVHGVGRDKLIFVLLL